MFRTFSIIYQRIFARKPNFSYLRPVYIRFNRNSFIRPINAIIPASFLLIYYPSDTVLAESNAKGSSYFSLTQPALDIVFNLIINNDYNGVKNLIAKKIYQPNISLRHPYGWTPLHLAVVLKNHSLVELFLNYGANVDEIDTYAGAYHMASVMRENSQNVENVRLKEFSEFLNPKSDFTGTTALHYAALMDDKVLIKRLLVAGANPLATNSKNHTPKLYAKNQAVFDMLNEAERKELKKLKRKKMDIAIEEIFKKQVIGQKEALKTVAGAIRRMEMGWQNAEHPLVFLFLGSSGIGKTELAKQIATYLHPDEPKAFIRIDMSEYQQKHEVSKLIGSPPGYIGHEQGGQLTQALAACPDAVVLFDEMEKAHPDVMTILLQLFDEGRLTDGKGRTIACKEAVFIMTSNVGSQAIAEYVRDFRSDNEKEFEISKDFKEGVMRPLLRRHFVRDEFLGRVNEMVYFVPFSQAELKQILTKILTFWKDKALKDHGIKLSWSNDAVNVLLEGYDVYFGARSLQYEVERKVVNQLVLAEMKNAIGEGSSVELVAQTGPNEKKFIALKIIDRSRSKNNEIVHLDSLASKWTSEKKKTLP